LHVALVYPNQLFDKHPIYRQADAVCVIEDPLFFSQYAFHAQKLVLHRASMKHFAAELEKQGRQVIYVENEKLSATGDIVKILKNSGANRVSFFEPYDDWLNRRLTDALKSAKLPYAVIDHPHFLTPPEVFDEFVEGRKKLFFTDFYIKQRKRLNVLLDEEGKPLGGKWSFDTENRKKLPKDVVAPAITWPKPLSEVNDASRYVREKFPKALGELDSFRYPVTLKDAKKCLTDFLDRRLENFGIYEDAIHDQESFLFHSVLTPALNIGLLSPKQVVDAALERIDQVPMNSLEGFLRQVIGWREFILGVYRTLGRQQRTKNYWGYHHAIPASFYDGSTGIDPVDTVIHRTLQHGYCHHIERLMILGNFMLLCEIDPDEVYRWFMELFIDSYDWVMVPNIYGMSQFADGGMITTKPYISGSSYVLKMSNFRRGPWCEVWDALYWRFIHVHRDFFSSNPRMSVMVAQCNKMGAKLDQHLSTAQAFLDRLHG
jgi:deoxyribodipyrimidine photolyase-related protein